MEELELSYIVSVKCKIAQALWKQAWHFIKKLNSQSTARLPEKWMHLSLERLEHK
jgi:hypothetical protein